MRSLRFKGAFVGTAGLRVKRFSWGDCIAVEADGHFFPGRAGYNRRCRPRRERVVIKHLPLTRPLAVLDLETTGKDPRVDRIVEIGIVVLNADGTERDRRVRRVNPTIPIPEEASEVHKIYDADVKDCPTFKMMAKGVAEFLDGCDLCGFNLKNFDLRLLVAEFARANVAFELEGRAVLDVMEIYHFFEKRGLVEAVQFYLGREHENAHSALADALATAELIDAMLDRYAEKVNKHGEKEMPRNFTDLTRKFSRPVTVDPDGTFTRRDGSIVFARTKYRGQPLDDVARRDPGYLDWILRADFGPDVKKVVREALAQTKAHSPKG
jgi:DNA polymerase-3 subunit epsilon